MARELPLCSHGLEWTPRSWYKSFMIGQERAIWQHISEAFIAKSGELDMI